MDVWVDPLSWAVSVYADVWWLVPLSVFYPSVIGCAPSICLWVCGGLVPLAIECVCRCVVASPPLCILSICDWLCSIHLSLVCSAVV